MWNKFFKIITFVTLLVIWGSIICYKIPLPAAEDLPRQMKNGEMVFHQLDVLTKNVYSYTEPENAFANHHWFYGVIVYWLHTAVGWSGMVMFKIVIFEVIFAVLFAIAIKKVDFWFAAVWSLPLMFVLMTRSALRPEMLSYLLIAIFLFLLVRLQENPQSKSVYWLIPLQLLWVNTHLYFAVGMLMVAGFLFEHLLVVEPLNLFQKFSRQELQKIWQNPLIKKLALTLVAVTAVSFLSPYGIAGAIFSLQVNANRDFPVSSQETQSISTFIKTSPAGQNYSVILLNPLIIIFLTSLLITLIYRFKNKKPWLANNLIFYTIACIATAILGFFVIRAIPLFAMMCFVAVAANMAEPYEDFKNWLFKDRSQTAIMTGIFIVLITLMVAYKPWIKILRGNEFGLGLAHNAEAAAKFWIDNNLQGPILNDTDIGSYLIYYLYPKEKVFVDNRFGDAYTAGFFNDTFVPMISDEAEWTKILNKYSFNAIFWYQYDRGANVRDFLYRRLQDPDWALVYGDNYSLILLRRNDINAGIIKKYEITRDNILDTLSNLFNSENADDAIAAADIAELLGRTDLALPEYLKVVSKWPARSRVWMVIGQILLSSADVNAQNPPLAALFLERAIAEGWKTPESYSYLALAYYRTGQIDRAKAAVDQELKIDPDSVDGQKWLGILAGQK